jgi:hypothetical protein
MTFVVKDSPGKGRGLFANRDISFGEVVLSEDDPVCCVFQNPKIFNKCHECLNSNPKICCNICESYWYCNDDCRERALTTKKHKEVCKISEILKNFENMGGLVGNMIKMMKNRMLMVTELYYRDQFGDLKNCESFQSLLFGNLENVERSGYEMLCSDFANILTNIINLNEKIPDEKLPENILKNCRRLDLNSQALRHVGEKLASGLFTNFSLLNHSCSPNCVVLDVYPSCDRFLEVRAIKNIKQNEELLISYIDITEKHETRSEKLKRYEFICQCDRCLKEEKAKRVYDKLHEERLSILEKIEAASFAKIFLSDFKKLLTVSKTIFKDVVPALITDKSIYANYLSSCQQSCNLEELLEIFKELFSYFSVVQGEDFPQTLRIKKSIEVLSEKITKNGVKGA